MLSYAYDDYIDGIYYNFSGDEAIVTYKSTSYDSYSFYRVTIPSSVTHYGKTYSVTSIGNCAFRDCSRLTSITIPNSVTSIGKSAFYGCSGLTSVTIPNSLTSIGYEAFRGCSGLTSVTIPNSVTSIDFAAFDGCSGLTSITIPESVTSIGNWAFYGCSGLTSVIIPNSVTSIGNGAFYGCSGLTSVTIGNGVTSIGESAFDRCIKLTSVHITDLSAWCNISFTYSSSSDYSRVGSNPLSSAHHLFMNGEEIKDMVIPESVTRICNYAFYDCSGLTSVTIPNSVTSIGSWAFSGCNNVKIYVNRGTDGLLAVWKLGWEPYEIGTTQLLKRPSISILSTTQTKVKYRINNIYPELSYNTAPSDNFSSYSQQFYGNALGNNSYILNVYPEESYPIYLRVSSANTSYVTSVTAHTETINPCINYSDVTATSMIVKPSYNKGDAQIISRSLTIEGNKIDDEKEIHMTGLDPDKEYNFIYIINLESRSYKTSKSVRTSPLTLTTQQPKVISAGNVVVAATSNLDDEETNVGFEWRRIDWTSDFASNTGAAYLYEGTMEGYIRNLYTEKLWKYRPYYEADSGNRYYGDWVGIDPTNTNYFEPTVHTYANINVTGNRAEVKGYAMRGTDRVTNQGFMYWKNTSSYSLRKKAASIPSDAITVEVSGNVMTATLEGLDYETEYCYVAFVKTEENETFFGEVQTFSTSVDPDGIEGVKADEEVTEIARYDLQGRKIAAPQTGLNIIRYSDGKTRKVLER